MSTSHEPGNSAVPDPLHAQLHAQLHARLRAAFEHEERLLTTPDVNEAVARMQAIREERAGADRDGAASSKTWTPRVRSPRFGWGKSGVDAQYRGARRWQGRIGGLGTRTLRQSISVLGTMLSAVIVGYVAWSAVRRPVTPSTTYVTGIGEHTTLRLSDGTHVTLAPRTSMTVAAGFGSNNRDVTLRGQAYFDVTSAQGRPFMVRVGTVMSRVLGTAFVVRHYPDDGAVVVAVRSGKVSVVRHNPVILTSNTVARITDSTIVMTTGSELHNYIEWRDGRLAFAGAKASEITQVLGQWYGLTFQFADSLMSRRSFSGVFYDHETRQEVLQDLQILLDARLSFRGDVITITPKRANTLRSKAGVQRELGTVPQEVGR